MQLAVIIPIYLGTTIDQLKITLDSLSSNTVTHRVVISIDGPIAEPLSEYIDTLRKTQDNIILVQSAVNRGPGHARHIAILEVDCELIAIIDAGDRSCAYRLDMQVNEFYKDPDLDICGGALLEFDIWDSKLRSMPTSTESIKRELKLRSPFNNITVMMKRSSYLEAGGYPDKRTSEDYELWVRCTKLQFKMKNLPVPLAEVDLDPEYIERRGGIKVLKDDFRTQRLMRTLRLITNFEYARNLLIYSIHRLMPGGVRVLTYRYLLRKGKRQAQKNPL